MHSFTLRSLRLLVTASSLAAATGCADDDSSATTQASSTSAADPSTGSSTAAEATTSVEPGTGSGPATTDAGSGSSSTDSADTDSATSTGTTGAVGLEIAGTWLEEFSPGMGITHAIDETAWEQLADFGDARFTVEAFDNPGRWVVGLGDASNEFYPDLYSRFDWTWDGADLYYCTAVFDAATAEDAMAAPASDPGDLAMGCGGFPWSPLVPVG